MKNIGVLLCAIALGIGIGTIIKGYEVPFGFILLLGGSFLLLIDSTDDNRGIPKMDNPPAPPKRYSSNGIEIPEKPKDRS